MASVPVVSECRSVYLLVTVPLPPSGSVPRFFAVDGSGEYPLVPGSSARCGYSLSVQPLLSRAAFRASFFSCHVTNQNDEIFSFSFRVVVGDGAEESVFNVSKTCSVPPLAPREVTCEENYMVSVKTDLLCTRADERLDSWQVVLQKEGVRAEVLSVSQAVDLGYFLSLTPGRIVFRSPAGRTHSSPQTVVKVSVLYRQSWMTLVVDLLAACSVDDTAFEGVTLRWRTPAVMTPLGPSALRSDSAGLRVNGRLLDDQLMEERGYSLALVGDAVELSVPLAAEGGVRKSFVRNNVYHEAYSVLLTYEQLLVDERGARTKQNVVRQMSSPAVPLALFSVNQTSVAERVFSVLLGNVPADVELVWVCLNGQQVSVRNASQSGFTISQISLANGTSAFVLRVPFHEPLVTSLYLAGGVFQYSLDITWHLRIVPGGETYDYDSPVSTSVTEAPPPRFTGRCLDRSVRFTKPHHSYDYLWDFSVGEHQLTPQLASQRGYVLTNDSAALSLDVPLFAVGFVYDNITLQQFHATFELLARNAKTLAVEQTSALRCSFLTTEMLVCSTAGVMTVVSDLSKAVPYADPRRTSLLDPSCQPLDTEGNRVLFSFGLNTCGTRVQMDQQYVVYENEIMFHEPLSPVNKPVITRDAAYRMTVRCIYPLHTTESLFTDWMFKAASPGIGQMKGPVRAPPPQTAADFVRVLKWRSREDRHRQSRTEDLLVSGNTHTSESSIKHTSQ